MTDNSLTIGADIGGTHITVALVDLDKKSIVPGTTTRANVNSHGLASEIIDVWSQAIASVKKGRNISTLSLAIPGPCDYKEGICLIKNQGKYENLYGLNIKALLSEQLDIRPEDIIMINDAAAFLEGEVFGGAARGFENAIGITLGTGLGTCIFKDHNASNADLWCMPFKAGIVEDYLSTRWFIGRYRELTGTDVGDVRELLSLVEIDGSVKLVFNEFGTNLADFLIAFLNISPAEVVVIGGNIAKSFSYFNESLLQRLSTMFPEIIIKTALLGEEAALIGAASHWKHIDISLKS